MTLSVSHLISINDLSVSDIEHLIQKAQSYKEVNIPTSLEKKNIFSLFFEDSTRTRTSFELATNKLGGDFINWDVKNSSANKGESLQDTVNTLNAMRPDAIIIRHSEYGAPQFVSTIASCPVINAGDSWNEHPSQALLDAMTIIEHFGSIKDKKIAICGDIAHSRVANSNMILLSKLGAHIHIVAPPFLMPEKFPISDVTTFDNLEDGIAGCDVVMMLRNQKERMKSGLIESDEQFFNDFGLTKDRLQKAKDNAIVLHPGPMNRNVEIADEVADDLSVSYILKQVENGVFMRMAIMDSLINKE
ncbi:MAG: aspartate carbamoyltransferase catalytic subunit [Pseudomonadota bacterium]